MRIAWSLPVRGERLGSARGDLVRARSLIEALRALGHDVVVLEAGAHAASEAAVRGYRSVARKLLPRRLALVARDVGRVLHARRHGRALAALARREHADVIVETQVHFAGSGAIAARATGLPLVLDDCSPVDEEIALGCGLPRLARRVFRDQARTARVLVVPSEALCARLEHGAERDVRIVPNGVELAAHDAARKRRDALRAELGLGDRVALAFVGSFQPWHRAGLLPEALAMIGAEGLALVLAGDGPGRERCVAIARAIPSLHVVDAGAVSSARVAELLAAADVGVLPETNDYGQPMKLLEYAAARLPSIAPDVPPVREVVGPRHALLVARGDANALSAAIAALRSDASLRERLGAAARREVAEPASWTARAQALAAIADECRTRDSTDVDAASSTR